MKLIMFVFNEGVGIGTVLNVRDCFDFIGLPSLLDEYDGVFVIKAKPLPGIPIDMLKRQLKLHNVDCYGELCEFK